MPAAGISRVAVLALAVRATMGMCRGVRLPPRGSRASPEAIHLGHLAIHEIADLRRDRRCRAAPPGECHFVGTRGPASGYLGEEKGKLAPQAAAPALRRPGGGVDRLHSTLVENGLASTFAAPMSLAMWR